MKHLNTLKDIFQQTVRKKPHATCVEIWDGQKYLSFTYQEIFDLVTPLGAGLIRLGLKKGERIILLGENSPGWIVCYLAIVLGGWVVVPLDKELKTKELHKQIKRVEAKHIFVSFSFLPSST